MWVDLKNVSKYMLWYQWVELTGFATRQPVG